MCSACTSFASIVLVFAVLAADAGAFVGAEIGVQQKRKPFCLAAEVADPQPGNGGPMTIPRHSVVVSIVVLVMFGAASAQGQTRLFVETSALFDQDGTYSGVGGTEPAVDLSVGVTLKESYTLRFSVEKPNGMNGCCPRVRA